MKIWWLSALAGVLLLAACGGSPGAGGPTQSQATDTLSPSPTAQPDNVSVGVEVGQRAPSFTLTSIDGETISSQEVLAGDRALLVYFFASW